MKNIFLAVTLLVGFSIQASLVAVPISLRPLPAMVGGDGPDQPVTLFQRGREYVSLRIPPNWKSVGSGTEVTFSLEGGKQSTAVWRVYTGKIKFDGEKKSMETFRKLAATSAPAGATDIVQSSEPLAGKIYGMNTLEAELSFQFYGNTFQRSILIFEDRDGQQYSFMVTSLASEFANVQSQAMGFLKTWWNVSEQELSEVRLVR